MKNLLKMIIKCATVAVVAVGWLIGYTAQAKVIIDNGNTSKIYLQADGKQITPADAYAQALQSKDVLECAHMDVKINQKTGKPALTKAK